MGCTSSAPIMADSQTSTTEILDSNLTSGDSEEIARENKLNSNGHQNLYQKQVLPKREVESSQDQLDRNNSSLNSDESNSKLHTVDVQVSATIEENQKTVDNIENSQKEELNLSLRDVVEKVISETNDEGEQKINNLEEIEKVADKQIEEIMEVNDTVNVEEIECNKDNSSEPSTSPTQSEDSRATRWEALADIAAELPPSLAVDPLTGQIYTLAK